MTLCSMLVLWAYNMFLIAAFFNIALERKKSVRTLVWGSVLFYAVICLLRFPTLWYGGLDYLRILNVLGQVWLLAYQLIFFRGSWQKRVLSIVLLMVFMSMIELTASWLAYIITGTYSVWEFNAEIYRVVCFLCFPITTISIYPLVRIWNMFQRIQWVKNRKGWLCVLFPLSQYLILECFIENYGRVSTTISVLILTGIILQGGGNLFMFALFYRENQRIQAEKELRLEQEIYKREQLYYRNIKENQKETERIRHDFQNYLLVLQSISQKKERQTVEGEQ